MVGALVELGCCGGEVGDGGVEAGELGFVKREGGEGSEGRWGGCSGPKGEDFFLGHVGLFVVGIVQGVLNFLDVAADRDSVFLGRKGYEQAVGQLSGQQAEYLRHGLVVDEAWVAILGHPVETVVVGVVVIDSLVVRAGLEAEVDAGDTGVVLESGKVASRTHGADLAVPEVGDGLAWYGLVGRLKLGSDVADDFIEKGSGVDA